MSRVLVVGCGLIGTSLGLALRGQRDVLLHDPHPDHLATAVSRGAGAPWDGQEAVDLVVLATPLAVIPHELRRLQRLDVSSTFTHVGSVQSQPLREAEALQCDLTGFCGGHPMAGKETAGPGSADAELFVGRPWFVCPGPRTAAAARAAVAGLARAVGADPVETTPAEHDRTVALVSHLPQVAASAVAARLLPAGGQGARFAGPGLVDTTRLAGSPVGLWQQVLAANAGEVAPLLRALARDLEAVADELAATGPAPAAAEELPVTTDLLRRGNAGRGLVPVKPGRRDADLAAVRVAVPDRPGQLALALQAAAAVGVNVEDLRVEHLPGRAQGTLQLLVAVNDRPALAAALAEAGAVVVVDWAGGDEAGPVTADR